ncbi:ribosome biogenesis GTPase YqeH [Hydrogenibacillus schlegelii]|uniref:CP-type G domain-containing protein n=1 Tax=Hydrogenibacillus schlegelii TaxID=1484 RepID=A0A179IRX9_HYDSH|nr:ribosome biogenesis GTPase YqeH [Hydrogenibacillus schlegelii]OAR05457.1 hypothetical protein SA87_11230 [Hydrogenibacillus schlegelii]
MERENETASVEAGNTETVRTCPGCGAVLQKDDPNRQGYVPPEQWERKAPLCLRCHRLLHYGEVVPVKLEADEYRRQVEGLGATHAILLVVDLFDVEGSVLPELHRFVGTRRVIVAANKVDLLPQAHNPERIRAWLIGRLRERGYDPEEVFLISAKSETGLPELFRRLEAERRPVAVVGAANVGKSSLLNRLIVRYGVKERVRLTTSRLPGTTLARVTIALPNGKTVVDTPGVLPPGRLTPLLLPEELKIVLPRRRIDPRIYQLQAGQTLFLGGLGRVDFVEGERQPFVLYVSNELYVHRTKRERAEAVYAAHRGRLLRPPAEGRVPPLPEWRRHRFVIRPKGAPEKRDLDLGGIGWVVLNGVPAVVDVYLPHGVAPELRPAMI